MSNKKNLLIYAHYYIPDTASTGQILRELAEGMLDKFNITIICVVPSYLGTIEDKYKTQKYYEEEINGVKVLRIRVPEFSKANKKSRVKNIVSYFFGAMGATFKVGKMDYVFSISQPPILGGLLGVWGKWVKHAKYIYNIQDFNPEQVLAVGYTKSKFVTDAMMWFDKFSCKRSDLIITVGRDLAETVENRFKGKKVPKTVMINNWIDENEIYPLDENNERVVAFKKKYGLISDVKSMFVYKVSNVVVTSTDNILISMLLGTIYVGFYSNYSMIINYIATFINLMITGLIASLGNLNADNDSEHSYSVFKGMVYLFGVITIFCSVCVLNAIQGFIPIWVGSEYVLGKDVLIAILATFYVTHAFDPTWMFCETMGLFKERKNAMVINAILNILLSVVLAKPFGMAGILGATAIARVLTIVWWEPYILFKKKFKRPLVDYIKQQAGIIGSNVLIVIFSYMLCSFVSESFMGLIVRIVISGLTVLLVELIFMRKTEEFAWAKNKLKQIIHR